MAYLIQFHLILIRNNRKKIDGKRQQHKIKKNCLTTMMCVNTWARFLITWPCFVTFPGARAPTKRRRGIGTRS